MKFLLACVFYTLLSFASFGQVLDLYQFPVDGSLPFNPAFITRTETGSLSLNRFRKPDGKPLKEEGISEIFQFDSVGRITSKLRIVRNRASADSSYTLLEYQGDNLWKTKSQDAFGRYELIYGYDKEGRKISETFFRISPSGSYYETGSSQFTYEFYPGQVKQLTLNAQGKPYFEEISYYSGDTLKGKFARSYFGNDVSETRWEYNAGGQIMRITKESSGLKPVSIQIIYDERGRLAGWKMFQGTIQTEEAEILWREGQKLPEAFIIRNPGAAEINVIRLNTSL